MNHSAARNYLRVRGEYGNPSWDCSGIWELPPRARRILSAGAVATLHQETTSACAENTSRQYPGRLWRWNYLRVRGEYTKPPGPPGDHRELPPRARRIHTTWDLESQARGTTSACAENTSNDPVVAGIGRNYLRVRGEYMKRARILVPALELPPRARRILHLLLFVSVLVGTTSACAENTRDVYPGQRHRENYLRVRGEYLTQVMGSLQAVELPPRARRIRRNPRRCIMSLGTTSACAENTLHPTNFVGLGGNYLRVRGEYAMGLFPPTTAWELPPRARRIRAKGDTQLNHQGTTSACAENT